MILPKGTTGFFSAEDKPSQVNPKQFSKACFNLVSGMKAKVLCISTQLEPDKNYYYAALEIKGRSVLILCNTSHPYIAFAKPGEDVIYEDFFDDADLASVFKAIKSFEVLPADILNAKPEPNQLSELSEVEISEIEHWKPSRLGEIVFNHWD